MFAPEDWNDLAGWERYHASAAAAGERADNFGSFDPSPPERLRALILELRRERSRVWVPGAGRSPFPAVLGAFGIEVVATDVSATALAYLRQSSAQVDEWIAVLRSDELEPEPAPLRVEHHDFREPFERETFELIFNIRAIQGFDRATMAKVARVHADALRPGRVAYFDTINVQDRGRDQLEDCLAEAGFTVPFHAQFRALRAEFRATAIPYAEVLGMPIVPQVGEYRDETTRRAAQARLREIFANAQARFDAAADEVRELVARPTCKRAAVIYATG